MFLFSFRENTNYKKIILKTFSIFVLVSLTPSCASSNKEEDAASTIASQPFKDLNLIKREIPPALAQITDPYATSPVIDCNWINYQLAQLNEVLPPDEIRAASVDERTNAERSSDAVNDATDSAVNTAATSVIPARGIVRKLSGASKNEREYNEAVERGKIRRGYLRGLARANHCRNIQ